MADAAAVAAIIPAAGTGSRLGSSVPKAFVEVDGLSLLARSAHAMSAVADLVVVAVPEGMLEQAAHVLAEVDAEVHVVVGGDQRQDSVAAALHIVPEHIDYILVHDAARAFVPHFVTAAVIAALEAGASGVIPVVPVIDTLRRVDEDIAADVVEREGLARVQTPQGFRRAVLVQAYAGGPPVVTDDAALVAAAGYQIKTVPGSERAFKVTTPDDLVVAAAYAGGPT